MKKIIKFYFNKYEELSNHLRLHEQTTSGSFTATLLQSKEQRPKLTMLENSGGQNFLRVRP